MLRIKLSDYLGGDFNIAVVDAAENESKKLLSFSSIEDYFENSYYSNMLASIIPAIKSIFYNQYAKHKVLQSSVLYETTLLYCLAKYYNLIECENTDEKVRFCYFNSNNISLYQKGNPDDFDGELNFNNKKIVIEIKRPLARAGSYDLKVDEKGFIKSLDIFQPEINKYLNKINILKHLGHNIKIGEDFGQEIGEQYFKGIDWLLTTSKNGNYLIVIQNKEELLNNLQYKNSEIRTTGKNWVKTKTLEKYFIDYVLQNGGALLQEKNIMIPKSIIAERTKSRNKMGYSDWRKINTIFRIKDKFIIEETEDKIICSIKDIEQNNPNISAKIVMEIEE